MGRLFGTDGVRGVANRELTPELAFAIGRAGAAIIAHDQPMEKPIVVGRDTRLSGTMLEAAIVAGITSTGRNVLALGIVPTPGVAAIVRHIEAAAGVMISASHNPIGDNGIKFFGADGFKLTDAVEDAIEAAMERDDLPRPTHEEVGIAQRGAGIIDRYFADLLAAGTDLAGRTIVVDAAFGAAFRIGPMVFERLGARVVALHDRDDGSRINVACGATHLEPLRAAVLAENARGANAFGVAFDGDADRALFVDETGATVSGDHVMLAIARDLARAGELRGNVVVGTVMSNVGLEHALRAEGIALRRAAVGDRYVLEMLRAEGLRFGGEQSGHIIDLERGTTGDGVMTGVRIASIVARAGSTLREITAGLVVHPQVLVNVRVADKRAGEIGEVRAAIENAARRLGDAGRILVRPSGTEPLVRVMVEGPDPDQTRAIAEEVAEVIRSAVTVS